MNATYAAPPSASELTAAAARLAPGRPGDCLFHLALPVSSPLGLAARRVMPGGWEWRGVRVPHDGADSAARLARLGWSSGDAFLDLSGDPCSWIKPVRSGAYVVFFGSDILFDLPKLVMDPRVAAAPSDLLAAVLAGALGPGRSWGGVVATATGLGWVLGHDH